MPSMVANTHLPRRASSPGPAPTLTPNRPAPRRMDSLPQHGFGPDLTFDKLVDTNPFLFRVYTPKSHRTAGAARRDPFFLGAKYDYDDLAPDAADAQAEAEAALSESSFGGIMSDGGVMSDGEDDSEASGPAPARATYADAVRHLDWTKRATSPFISTSFSFAWAIWDASRRYKQGVKHDVHIAVIDARAVIGRAVTALELLRDGKPTERHRDHWKFYRFASEAQDVLVFGYIPPSAVLSSVPLVSLLPKLPSYFLREDAPEDAAADDLKAAPFAQLAWDARSAPSFKTFCQDLSERFLRAPDAQRLRDTSAGAVRLAIALLRPFVHRALRGDPPAATQKAAALGVDVAEVERVAGALALGIAQWPAQWWARDRAEIAGLVAGTVQLVTEEVADTRRAQALREVERLQAVVAGLQRSATSLAERVPTQAPAPPPPAQAPQALLPIPTHLVPEMAAPAETPNMSSAMSALISGLLFGSFCMLSIIHSQRWELANHLT